MEARGAAKLKGLYHEDFAVLGQLCANSISYCVYTYAKFSCETIRKISNGFYQGELTIIIILVIFEDMASKLEKIDPIFSSSNPFPSLPFVATDDRKQFQRQKTAFNNKTNVIVFGIQLMRRHHLAFENI